MAAASNMKIDFQAVSTEQLDFTGASFDVITACQCFWYFDHERVMPKLAELLKTDGRLLILYMAWLPYEDTIAKASEDLVLKYNPKWTGYGETKHSIHIRQAVLDYFEPVEHEEYDLSVPFTRESWHGRMRACRGVGASLNAEELAGWETEHRELLETIAPEEFSIHHYAAIAVLEKRAL
jgi:SAM-dependent methyltransferase